MTDWSELREALRERSGGYCEACGWPLPVSEWAAHHRLLRSQGGKDELVNLIAIHHSCHNMARNSIHDAPEAAYKAGQLVRMGSEPASTPLRLPDGSWCFLQAFRAPDGRPQTAYQPIPTSEEYP